MAEKDYSKAKKGESASEKKARQKNYYTAQRKSAEKAGETDKGSQGGDSPKDFKGRAVANEKLDKIYGKLGKKGESLRKSHGERANKSFQKRHTDSTAGVFEAASMLGAGRIRGAKAMTRAKASSKGEYAAATKAYEAKQAKRISEMSPKYNTKYTAKARSNKPGASPASAKNAGGKYRDTKSSSKGEAAKARGKSEALRSDRAIYKKGTSRSVKIKDKTNSPVYHEPGYEPKTKGK